MWITYFVFKFLFCRFYVRVTFFVYFVLLDNRTCFSLESGECGINGSDDCGTADAFLEERNSCFHLRQHGVFSELAFCDVFLRVSNGDVLQRFFVRGTVVDGNVLHAGQDHQHV